MSQKFKNLLEFLEGPVWNTPIMTFIEVKSAGEMPNLSFLIV